MKIRSAILAVVITCAALLILAPRTEAVSPSAAQKVGLALLPSPTATLLPTLPPDVFTMSGAVTFRAPDNSFTIKIPKSWHAWRNNQINSYSFYAGDITNPDAQLGIQFVNTAEFADGFGLKSSDNLPLEALKLLSKGPLHASNTVASQVYSARVGSLTGVGITLSDNSVANQTTDIRIVQLTKNTLVLTDFYTNQQYWNYAKPVLNGALLSLTFNADILLNGIPTLIAPTATAIPPLVFTPSAQSDVKQSVDADGSPLLGDPNTPITILEYVDFACIHCGEYQPVMRQVIDKYVRTGEVRVIVRFVRFVGDKYSELSASAAICAAKQGHFLDMEEALFAVEQQQSYESYTTETIQTISTQLKMDTDKMTACLQDPATLATFEKDVDSATDLGIQGVPSILYAIDGKNFTGIPDSTGQFTMQPSFDDIAHTIEAAFDPGKSEM